MTARAMRSDPAWLRECLVRWLAKKPGPAIAVFLRMHEKHHGKPAAETLMAEVRSLRQRAPYAMPAKQSANQRR